MVKTMRDIWDREKKEKKEKEIKKRKIFPSEGEESKLSSSPFAVAREIEKHYLDYLARKRAFLKTKREIAKAFADYKSRLGEAGFSKIL